MRKTIVTCDNPYCSRVETIPNPGIREVPDKWISLKVEVPNRSWPFGTANRTFCQWGCVSAWAVVLHDTNGEGFKAGEVPARTGDGTIQDPVSGWVQDR